MSPPIDSRKSTLSSSDLTFGGKGRGQPGLMRLTNRAFWALLHTCLINGVYSGMNLTPQASASGQTRRSFSMTRLGTSISTSLKRSFNIDAVVLTIASQPLLAKVLCPMSSTLILPILFTKPSDLEQAARALTLADAMHVAWRP